MRAREFIREFDTIALPKLPVGLAPATEIEPGTRTDNSGDPKWSPPLQQHLDAVKDSVRQAQVADAADIAIASSAVDVAQQDTAPKPVTKSTRPEPLVNLIPGLLG